MYIYGFLSSSSSTCLTFCANGRGSPCATERLMDPGIKANSLQRTAPAGACLHLDSEPRVVVLNLQRLPLSSVVVLCFRDAEMQ